ncbi:periplasmic metalloprotease [Kordiimonas sediminis]|uniref:Periplasmic metalloprotease n=1 Tax=Kordiimonas sediminis TaxID=1735581 RepID=A0A919E539_9PROT|nr:zinc-dependent metalloprotease [Kordiimonas sediminis]GHF14725.1 periplasmic metalloprotease [Kordiimonas sediminis]
MNKAGASDHLVRRGVNGIKPLLGLLVFVWMVTVQPVTAQTVAAEESFLPFTYDAQTGRVLMEIPARSGPFIMQAGTATGLGANPIGIDRQIPGRSKLVQFERLGPKVFLRHLNMKFRAEFGNVSEARTVDESFADSILWGFEVQTENATSYTVDLTDFLLADQAGIQARLRSRGKSSYQIDLSRSAIYGPRTKFFPKNSEFETLLTFTGEANSPHIRSVAAPPIALTVRQHISFVALPDDGYKPRAYHADSSFTPERFRDYSVGLTDSLDRAYIRRFRLEKKNPEAPISEAVKPIIYYIDRGMPEPVRSAIMEGGMWWNSAFEAAGYKNAFQIRLMPEDMDPLDARYNVINWVHRETRGYSTGSYVSDPRTGEILKATVTIGSLRVRQNMLMATALMGPYETAASDGQEAIDFALARQRQLSAHEIGHSLGLAHNSIASTSPLGRASAMDDPFPMVKIRADGALDFSEAYFNKVGAWDKVSIAYGYSDFPEGSDENAALAGILEKARAQGLRFFSHHGGIYDRSVVNGHTHSHIWDVGEDIVLELGTILKVRSIALANFSEKSVPVGASLSTLEDSFATLYYYFRYQVEAVAKHIGGRNYEYAVRRAEGQQLNDIVPAEGQERALSALLAVLTPETLEIPDHILDLIPPKALGDAPDRESMPRKNGLYLTIDPLAASEAASNHLVSLLLHPARLARVSEFSLRDDAQMSLPEYLGKISAHVFAKRGQKGMAGAVARSIEHVYLHLLMQHASDRAVSAPVRAYLRSELHRVEARFNQEKPGPLRAPHVAFQRGRLQSFFAGEYVPARNELAQMPPGSPI